MGIKVKQQKKSTVVCLDGVIDIASAAELKTTLLDALKPGKPVRISLDESTDLDVTAIQLLWAADREARASGAGLQLAGPVPEKISETLKDAGFEPFSFTL